MCSMRPFNNFDFFPYGLGDGTFHLLEMRAGEIYRIALGYT